MPANYQYDLSECINKIIHFDNKKLIQKLEKDGFLDEQHKFNYFCFSNLDVKDLIQEDDRLITENDSAEMLMSVMADDAVSKNITELFTGKELRFGDKKDKVTLKIITVEQQQEPKFSESMDFRLISPLVITTESGSLNTNTKYLSPEDKDYEMLFIKSLMTKYALLMKSAKSGFDSAMNSNFSKLKLKCITKPVSRLVKVNDENHKPVSVRGYLFDFNITAPEELIKLGYYSGFGEFNNMGFGCCVIR